MAGKKCEFLGFSNGRCLKKSSDTFVETGLRTIFEVRQIVPRVSFGNYYYLRKHAHRYSLCRLKPFQNGLESSNEVTCRTSNEKVSNFISTFHEGTIDPSRSLVTVNKSFDTKDMKTSSRFSIFSIYSEVQLSKRILSFFILLVLLAKCSLADFCLPKCSCTFVPSPTLATDKWASLMPSASPTLLASLIYPQSIYPKKYSNLTGLWPKLVNSTAVDLLSPDNAAFNSENQTTSKNKRDVRREDSVDYNANVSENIIEIHDPILSPDFDKDYESRHKPPAEQAKVYPEYIQSLMNDPYVRRLLLNRKRKQDHVDRTSPRIPDREDSSLSNKDGSVPEVIQEQIPDFYRGIITPHKNLREEIRWIGNETSETHPKKFEEDEDSRAFTTKKRVAVLCERNRFVSVPEEEETSRNFSLTDIISL